MNESDFEAKLGTPFPEMETLIKVSGSGKFIFSKQRIFGVIHFLKKPAPDYVGDPQVVESLRKEFSIGLNLNHPGVVRYINFDGQVLYEEFIDGQSLRDLIDNGDARLHDKEFVQNLVAQLFETISYLHQTGVLHLDLKPENILIPRIGNQSKIIDFGCAFNSQNDSTQGYTPGYKAPEQGKTQSDCRIDIYQIGRIGEELSTQLKMSRKWNNFIKKSVSEKPELRFQSANEALTALRKINQKKRFPSLTIFGMFIVALMTTALVTSYFKLNNSEISVSDPVSPSIISEQEGSSTGVLIPETDKSIKENPSFKEPEISPSSSLYNATSTSTENTQSKIKKELQTKITALYKKNVSPYVVKSSSLTNDERFGKIQEGFQKCQTETFQLMEKLKHKYPTMSDYIEAETTSLIENQQMVAMFKYDQTL